MTTEPQPLPTDAELRALLPTKQLARDEDPKVQVWLTQKDAFAFARSVLAKWGTPAPVGVEPVAYMTRDEESSPAMLFFERSEALGYCADDELPAPLYTAEVLAMGRVPLSDAQCDAIYAALDQFGRGVDTHEYGLPIWLGDDAMLAKVRARELIRNAAHGIKQGGQHAS